MAADSQCGLAVVGRIWGCARSHRRIGNYDASFGCRFKHAQKQAASRCYVGVLVSNPNSNKEVFCDETRDCDCQKWDIALSTIPLRTSGARSKAHRLFLRRKRDSPPSPLADSTCLCVVAHAGMAGSGTSKQD